MAIVKIFFAVAGSFFLSTLVAAQELPAVHYTTEKEINPLPNPAVTGLYQDRLGYMWLCAYGSGLVRYDGHKMEIFDVADSLSNLKTWSMLEDSTGRLWVSSEGGLNVSAKPLADYANGERIKFLSHIGKTSLFDKPFTFGRQIALDKDGQIWIATRADGIIRYRWQHKDDLAVDTLRTNEPNQSENLRVFSLIARRNGAICAAMKGKAVVFNSSAQMIRTLTASDSLPGANTSALYEGRSGILFGACVDGTIWKLDEKTNPAVIKIIHTGLKHPTARLYETTDGNLWIATLGSGLVELNHRQAYQASVYGSKNGLLGEVFWDVLEDREGNLWLAQNTGLSKLPFNFRAFQFYSAKSYPGQKPNLPASGVMAVMNAETAAHDTILWAGTENGLAAFKANGQVETLNAETGLTSNIVFGIAADKAKRLWIATRNGVNCLSTQPNFPHFPAWPIKRISLFGANWYLTGDAIGHMNVSNIYQLSMREQSLETIQSFWGSAQDLVQCYLEGEWLVFRQAAGIPLGRVWATAVDAAGRVWVSTEQNGVYRSRVPLTVAGLKTWETKAYKLSPLTMGKEVLSPVFVPVLPPEDKLSTMGMVWVDSLMWVAADGGVFAIRADPPKIVAHLSHQDGLSGDGGFTINYSPATRKLWNGTNAGLDEIDPVTKKVLRTVTRQHGLIGDNCWGIAAINFASDGTIYYGTSNGLNLYRPAIDKSNTMPPRPQIRHAGFHEDGWGQNEITFEYAALSYANEKLVKYKTRLVGYDKIWSPETTENKIRYTNLPAFFFAKTYRFEVMACNNNGIWTTAPLRYVFAVKPAWWLRWWAIALQLAIVAGIAIAVQRHRTQQLRDRSRILEQTVQERTAEIQAQKESVELLSHIGKDITASLDFDTIFDRLYENVNHLAEATIFGVGIYHPEQEQIEYRLAIAKGKRYAPYTRETNDKNQFPVWCIENRQPVFINDVATEYSRYISRYEESGRVLEDGTPVEKPQSLIYLPLVAQERVLGVITIQSFQKNAYTEHHLNLLQNLAAYTTIALDNADAYRRLNVTLDHLKSTQQQLITQEKLASLGQLTAGIAHEIKNPLNFVNNFAILTLDLTKELREVIKAQNDKLDAEAKANMQEVLQLLDQNVAKINEHGKRADSIVKGMLLHSRGESGERRPADVNAILDEYVMLAYHGMRGTDSTFNIKIEKDYDASIGRVEVFPQDLSRVFLNLVNNACYATHEKKKNLIGRVGEGENVREGERESGRREAQASSPSHPRSLSPTQHYTPTLSVRTKNLGDQIEIRIRDNGNGIPKNILDKIFTPFFTTKPTGQGTGLGLSISYDIIVQEHKGEIKVETEEGSFTEFIIRLPRRA